MCSPAQRQQYKDLEERVDHISHEMKRMLVDSYKNAKTAEAIVKRVKKIRLLPLHATFSQ